jgi:thymidine kinase
MSLLVIKGPMFAGKSSELQSIKKRRTAICQNVLVIKHSIDVRYLTVNDSQTEVINHDKNRCSAVACSKLCDLLGKDAFNAADLLIIDEGQFFDDLVEFAVATVETWKKDLIVVGLSGDVHRKPFKQMAELEAIADCVKHLKALCQICGNGTEAHFTCAKSKHILNVTKDGSPNVGDESSYIPVCRRHYIEIYKGLN